MDAYVLSESSLFVYRHRYIMKTCGTTTLLCCLNTLFQFADNLGMEIDWVVYSRKNLLFPSAQKWPHSSFGDEIDYLSSPRHGALQARLRGSGYILGPITADHWFVYVADHAPPQTTANSMLPAPTPVTPSITVSAVPALAPLEKPSSPKQGHGTPPFITSPALSLMSPGCPETERTLNLMMFDLAPEVCSLFMQAKNGLSAQEMTRSSGIDRLCPGASIDDRAFSPCGYSMNAILHDAYATVHVTPEPECSYASFETNTCLRDYAALIRNVLNAFRPRRFVLTVLGDEGAVEGMAERPTDSRQISCPGMGPHARYLRTSASSSKVQLELCCLMGCYALETAPTPGAVAAASSTAASPPPSLPGLAAPSPSTASPDATPVSPSAPSAPSTRHPLRANGGQPRRSRGFSLS